MAKKGSKQVAREMLAKLKAEAISSFGELGVAFHFQDNGENEHDFFKNLQESLFESQGVLLNLLFRKKHGRSPVVAEQMSLKFAEVTSVRTLRQAVQNMASLTDDLACWEQALRALAGTELRFAADAHLPFDVEKRNEYPPGIQLVFGFGQATLFFYFVRGSDNKYRLFALPTVLHELAPDESRVTKFNNTVEHFGLWGVLRELLEVFNNAPAEAISLLVDVFRYVVLSDTAGRLSRLPDSSDNYNNRLLYSDHCNKLRYCADTNSFV